MDKTTFEIDKPAGHMLIHWCSGEGFRSTYTARCLECDEVSTVTHKRIKQKIRDNIKYCDLCRHSGARGVTFPVGKPAGHLMILSCTDEGHMSRYEGRCLRCNHVEKIYHQQLRRRIRKNITHCEHCKSGPKKSEAPDIGKLQAMTENSFRSTGTTGEWYPR